MLLSIGMIVKNEEKYLERCLSALKPILDNVDSELIIADTGSDDRTVEIAKKFTDNVYYFEWINDFSAARNSTYDKAQGEWYMFVDADEIIESCDEIINFFNSGKYTSYGSASFTVRSFTDSVNTNIYTDDRCIRLTERKQESRFVNAIHETFATVFLPTYYLETVAFHYGYIFRENGKITELAITKTQRNLDLLLKDLENGSIHPLIYSQIADCYVITNEIDNALKYFEMGLNATDPDNISIITYYCGTASLLLRFLRFNDVLRLCDKYFSSQNKARKKVLASDSDMYGFQAQAYHHSGRYSEAVSSFIEFFKLRNAYAKGKLNTEDLLHNRIRIDQDSEIIMYNLFMSSCVKSRKFNSAVEYLKGFSISNNQNKRKDMFTHSYGRMMIFENTDYKGLRQYAEKLDDYNRKLFFQIARCRLFSINDVSKALDALESASRLDDELDLAMKIYRAYFDNEPINPAVISEFVSKYGTESNGEILCILMSSDMDISVFVNSPSFNANECAKFIFTDYNMFIPQIEKYNIDLIGSGGLTDSADLYGFFIRNAIENKMGFMTLAERYGEISNKWSEVFSSDTPSDSIAAGMIIHKTNTARSGKDYSQCIGLLKKLAKEHPHFIPFVKEYTMAIKRVFMNEKGEKNQLVEMSAAVKKNVRNMIAAKNFVAAEKTLRELAQLVPGDPEIDMLYEEIEKSR